MATRTDRNALERILLLRTFSGFRTMSLEQLASIAEHGEEREYPPGAEIYPEGVPVEAVHYLFTGLVEMRRRGEVVSRMGDRSVIGGLSAFAGISDGLQVVALQPTRTLVVKAADMVDVFEDNFEMLSIVLGNVARTFVETRMVAGPSAGFAEPEGPGEPCPPHLDVVDKIMRLRASPAFAHVPIEATAQLARLSEVRRFQPGDRLWTIGDASGKVLVLCSGIVRGENPGQRFRFGPGDLVGGLGSMGGVARWYDAVSETEGVAIEFDMDVLLDVLEDNGEMALATIGALAAGVLTLREATAAAASPP